MGYENWEMRWRLINIGTRGGKTRLVGFIGPYVRLVGGAWLAGRAGVGDILCHSRRLDALCPLRAPIVRRVRNHTRFIWADASRLLGRLEHGGRGNGQGTRLDRLV